MQHLEMTQLTLGEWGTNCYILTFGPTGDALIVDPAAQADRLLETVAGLNVAAILLTHAHPDHVAALDEVRAALDSPVGLHPADADLFGIKADFDLLDGDKVPLGIAALTVFHIPGHTPGSIGILLDAHGAGRAIVGDAIFPGGPGHTNRPGDLNQSLDSLTRSVFTWSDDTRLFPGHGDSTTVGAERAAFEAFVASPRPAGLCGDVAWR